MRGASSSTTKLKVWERRAERMAEAYSWSGVWLEAEEEEEEEEDEEVSSVFVKGTCEDEGMKGWMSEAVVEEGEGGGKEEMEDSW